MDRGQLEKVSKALADKTRLLILEAISRRKNITCGEIVTLRGVTPATVSHHLKILSAAGLIECHKEGQFVCSRVIPDTIAEYTRALSRMTEAAKKPQG
jgi:DNA-binding transcriptional ArsR family regulator